MLALFTALAIVPFAPVALGLQPTARWGHQAVYVPSEHAMYVIGGQVQTPGTQITNEVLVLPLNGTNPSYQSGSSGNLPPNAFAGAALSHDGKSIVVVGGVSANCSSDSIAHVYGVTGEAGGGGWTDYKIDNLVRRRGSALMPTAGDNMMLLGGIADQYSCASTTRVYPAADTLNIPITSNSLAKSDGFPSDLTGSALAVSDSAVTTSTDHKTIYMVGGQAADGSLTSMDTMGVYTNGAWKSQKLGGNIPVGRIGATIVAHPFLDLLVLSGGARNDRGNDVSTTLLAFLNTTTWEWSIPSHLQPPQVSAVSYHASIMTPEGVMISSFGLNAAGSPRADTYYLDMRDPTQDGWTWKGQWNSDMTSAIASEIVEKPKRNIASIVAPIVILVIILPLAIWLIRRQVRINRKRRQARYFSFSSQEDEGQFKKKSFPWLRRGSEGWDVREVYRRFTGGKTEEVREKNWEEIDFGLGSVDERRGSRSALRQSISEPRFLDQPMASGVTYTPAVHVYEPSDLPYTADPFADQAEGQVIPALTIQPPTAHPTPAAEPTEAFPVARPLSSSSDDAQALDWSALEQSLTERPAFRSISPTSTLRSHQPGHQLPERRPSTDRPALPPLDFGPRRSVSGSRPQSMIAQATPRSVSSPMAGRQIAGSMRRHSADVQTDLSPVQSVASPVSSGYGTPQISTAVRFDARDMSRSGTYGSVSRDRPMSALRIANPSDDE